MGCGQGILFLLLSKPCVQAGSVCTRLAHRTLPDAWLAGSVVSGGRWPRLWAEGMTPVPAMGALPGELWALTVSGDSIRKSFLRHQSGEFATEALRISQATLCARVKCRCSPKSSEHDSGVRDCPSHTTQANLPRAQVWAARTLVSLVGHVLCVGGRGQARGLSWMPILVLLPSGLGLAVTGCGS